MQKNARTQDKCQPGAECRSCLRAFFASRSIRTERKRDAKRRYQFVITTSDPLSLTRHRNYRLQYHPPLLVQRCFPVFQTVFAEPDSLHLTTAGRRVADVKDEEFSFAQFVPWLETEWDQTSGNVGTIGHLSTSHRQADAVLPNPVTNALLKRCWFLPEVTEIMLFFVGAIDENCHTSM